MKKLVYIVFLAAASSFAQSPQTEFTINQIDSITLKTGRAGVAEGKIKSEKIVVREDKKSVVKGEGQSWTAIYLYHAPTFSRLTKGEYRRTVTYEDKSSEDVFAKFYHNEKQLFYIKLIEIISDGKKETTKEHNIDVSKMDELQDSDFLFTTNIRKWISQLDGEILDLSKSINKK